MCPLSAEEIRLSADFENSGDDVGKLDVARVEDIKQSRLEVKPLVKTFFPTLFQSIFDEREPGAVSLHR